MRRVGRKEERKRLNRSKGGDVAMIIILSLLATLSILPIVLIWIQSLKPLNELFLYPPKLYVRQPTLENFRQLFSGMSNSWVPISRYFFNTAFVTVAGTVLHIIFASMAAYPLAKHKKMPGAKMIFTLITVALMFNAVVADVVNYITMSALRWVDTYLALIIPAIGSPLGIFIMKQFMEQIPDSLIEAAKMDGASDFKIYWTIVMPMVRPAWLTVGIFSFLALWGSSNTTYIYSEQLKSLPYAMLQIASGGITKAGAASAAAIVLMIVPIVFFLTSQDKIVETMAASGIKE